MPYHYYPKERRRYLIQCKNKKGEVILNQKQLRNSNKISSRKTFIKEPPPLFNETIINISCMCKKERERER